MRNVLTNTNYIIVTYSININEKTSDGKALIKILKKLGFTETKPDKEIYDPKFVRKIKSQEGETAKKIKTEDLWK